MAIKKGKNKPSNIPKIDNIEMDKISIFFKKSILKTILRILTMEHSGFRTYKSIKNINRLFNNIDMEKYNDEESKSYIWCILYISKQWLDGIVDINLIIESIKYSPEYDNKKEEIISSSINDDKIVNSQEAKMIFDLIGECLQYGYITSLKEKYISLLDDIDLNEPGAFRELSNRLFNISQSLVNIKYSTNVIDDKITFNTGDKDSVKESLGETIDSLTGSNSILKTGIRRLNTILSPGYMNRRLYVYIGLASSWKSGNAS